MVLIVAAGLSALAAALHLCCIAFGPSWYRAMGAGEGMARLAEMGSPRAAVITVAIASVLMVWSLYALSGAGVIARLPLLRTGLCAITAVYLLRGLGGFAFVAMPLGRTPTFWLWSSAICLLFGVVHLVGVRQVWERL